MSTASASARKRAEIDACVAAIRQREADAKAAREAQAAESAAG